MALPENMAPKESMVDHHFYCFNNSYSGVYPKATKPERRRMNPTYAPDTERSQTGDKNRRKSLRWCQQGHRLSGLRFFSPFFFYG